MALHGCELAPTAATPTLQPQNSEHSSQIGEWHVVHIQMAALQAQVQQMQQQMLQAQMFNQTLQQSHQLGLQLQQLQQAAMYRRWHPS